MQNQPTTDELDDVRDRPTAAAEARKRAEQTLRTLLDLHFNLGAATLDLQHHSLIGDLEEAEWHVWAGERLVLRVDYCLTPDEVEFVLMCPVDENLRTWYTVLELNRDSISFTSVKGPADV